MLITESPHSSSFDKDKEFAQHKAIAQELNAGIYFTMPNYFWERSSNENTNGLIRQQLPKHMPLAKVNLDYAKTIENNLNDNLIKISEYRTPLEVKNSFR